MAAGMHLAVVPGAVPEIVLLVEVEGVEIGAQPDRPGRGPGLQPADHAGLCQPSMDLDAEALQLFGDDVGRAVFLEGGFRMGMDIPAPYGHVVVEIGDAVDNRHGSSLLGRPAPV